MKNRDIGHVFELGGTPSGDIVKQMAQFDSVHQIGPTTVLQDVLMVVRGPASPNFKKSENWENWA